jgi:predicted ATPase
MLLKQTIDSSDRQSVFFFGGKNALVQTGSYQEMVFDQDDSKSIEFGYAWDLKDAFMLHHPVSKGVYDIDRLEFSSRVGMVHDPPALFVKEINYQLFSKEKAIDSIRMKRDEQSNYFLESNNNILMNQTDRSKLSITPVRFYGFPNEILACYQNVDYVQSLNLETEFLFKKLSYLGPLRAGPERLYTWSGLAPESVGISGENTIAALLAARNRTISLNSSTSLSFETLIAAKLSQMGLIDQFVVQQIANKRQEYEVKILTRGTRNFVSLPDAGAGISQVLPVLVQSFYTPNDSIIIMEQPEIHLHPKAQAELADVMIDVITARENGKYRNIQVIIETHSEYFLRRLQRRIAENCISEDKVAAYFANVNQYPATLEKLKIDHYGNIQNWPDNFFGDEMQDITHQAKAAMKKRLTDVS